MKPGDKITEDGMIDALKRSGYLIESRLIDVLSKREYVLYPNETYPDNTTLKSREIDIYASSYRTVKNLNSNNFLHINVQHSVIVECINNPQPAVFFKRNEKNKSTIFAKFRYNKIERETVEEPYYPDFNFSNFITRSAKFHYNQLERSSQYCSFSLKKDNREWLASHPDALHETLNKLHDFVHHKHNSTEQWMLKTMRTATYLNLKYPLIVFQGDLYEACEEGDLSLKKVKHVIFEFNKYDGHKSSIIVDIITEDYFEKYLDLLRNDMIRFSQLYESFYSDKTLIPDKESRIMPEEDRYPFLPR